MEKYNQKDMRKMILECLSEKEDGIEDLAKALVYAFSTFPDLKKKETQEELVEIMVEVLNTVNNTRIPNFKEKEEENDRFNLMDLE